MKMKLLIVVCISLLAAFGWLQTTKSTANSVPDSASTPMKPVFHTAAEFAVSPEVRHLTTRQPLNRRVEPRLLNAGVTIPEPSSRPIGGHDADAAIATVAGTVMPPPELSFDGLTNFDNIDAYGMVIIPPDISADVGPNHYVQAVNALVRVFDKGGQPVTPPFKMSDLFAPLNTACSSRDDGDPIVAYDPLADRWLLSEYCSNFPPFRQMVAISKTSDPTGAYFVYEFIMPNVKINDFPKFGVWPDGYYMSTEEFLGSDFAGSGVFAFDRAKMLAGDPAAGYIYFNQPSNSPVRRSNLIPADLDGLRPPPAGSPNTFVSYTANEYGDAEDAITLFDLHADFRHPENSTFAERAESPLAVAAFDPTSPDERADISQPAPGEKLDSNSDRVNYRAAYRNFGDHESIVVNQTVRMTQDPQPYRAGVRVYELQRAGSREFRVTEQSTIGNAESSRWIGNVAQDHQGDLAVSYNVVSDEKPPSVHYTGRLRSEPAGSFRTEAVLVDGTGVQKAFGWRWGDYAAINVDPVDDCTFWASGQYYTAESEQISDFTWLSRTGKFRFPECTSAPRSFLSGKVTNAVTGLPIAQASVVAGPFSRSTQPDGGYGNMMLIPGTYTVTASAPGYRSRTANVVLADGATVTLDFALPPIAVFESAGADLLSESCATNGAPDPGETVTYSVSLRNTGAITAFAVTAMLIPSDIISGPSTPQDYGQLVAGGPAVARPFTFTVSPSVACGSPVSIGLKLTNGNLDLGMVSIVLNTGTPRIAFRENFERVPSGQLPQRWTRSASGADGEPDYARNWRVTSKRSFSGSKSAFGPDPNQVGLSEMVSPVFRVQTPDALLTFENWYDLETTFLRNRLYDGSVLEISIDGTEWQDIESAGGRFESGGYDGLIDACCHNPLAGHNGWSGKSGPNQTPIFITTAVRLPAAAAGHMVQLRWRTGTDIGTFREGQYIDDVTVSDGSTCGCSLTGQK
jgi:uncharacterized repeat protein (TIGR01451 family)